MRVKMFLRKKKFFSFLVRELIRWLERYLRWYLSLPSIAVIKTESSLGDQWFISPAMSLREVRVWKSSRAAIWRQELKHKSWRSAADWFTPHRLLCMFLHLEPASQGCRCLPTVGVAAYPQWLGLLHQLLIKKIPENLTSVSQEESSQPGDST